MPELPEVETTLRGVLPHIVNREITRVCVRDARLRWPVTPDLAARLTGERILQGHRRAKYLLFQTSGVGTLLIHLGMSGSLRIADPTAPFRKHDHVVLEFADGMQLRFHDPRRFGAVMLTEIPPEQHELLRALGPEPLADTFTVEHLQRQCWGKKAAIKTIIMDAAVVVGVGNIYACEALFMAGIRPSKAAGRVTKAALSRLVASIREVLAASIEQGGTTLRDFLRENGEPGYFKQSLRVYDREGEACRQCPTLVKRTVLGQRSTFYCPKCQP
jgi:formamidopyrimidine-DNA glycosylase